MILLSLPDAAHIYDVPESTIRRWLAEERICRHGDRRPYRVDANEIEQMLARRLPNVLGERTLDDAGNNSHQH